LFRLRWYLYSLIETEAHQGNDISLSNDGSIRLGTGTYHLSGFSVATMQVTAAPPVSKYNMTYPGYALLYYKGVEDSKILQTQFCIGSLGTAFDMNPSLFM
jgi:hypothetical protein